MKTDSNLKYRIIETVDGESTCIARLANEIDAMVVLHELSRRNTESVFTLKK